MKINQLLLPLAALSAGSCLFLSGADEASGYNTNGASLTQSQRDFRIFNNFTGNLPNNNTEPHPMFPGYDGAEMAIWKGCVEWGSLPHGDGSGDSSQPIIGSGGANFDPSFQGNATEVGGANGNTHSQISGAGGSVLAFAEGPYSNGWRIRYYEDVTWADGPDGIPLNHFDLQGVACHEYGHVIGLSHSGESNATMAPSTGPASVNARSISLDDQAGIQSIYGSMSSSKPVITGVTIVGNQITVEGSGFNSSGNQIWFTQAGTGGNGTPIKVTGLNSNGSSLTATIPGNAGPGDVLARRNSTGFSGLSNAWPTDLEPTPTCVDPSNFCFTLPNSTGGGASIGYTGSTSLSDNDFALTCSGLPSNGIGIFFYGDNESGSPFGDGVLCVVGNIVRLNVQSADVLGFLTKNLDWDSAPFDGGNGAAISGQTKRFQFWYRDVLGGPAGFNTSDGLAVSFCD